MLKAILAICVLCLSHSLASAAEIVSQPEASLFLAPPVFTGSFIDKLGDRSIQEPTWHITQGSGGVPLASTDASYSADPGASWIVQNRTTRIAYYAAPGVPPSQVRKNTLELAQNSFGQPCNQEWDLYAESTAPHSYKDPSGKWALSRVRRSMPLGHATSINVHFGFAVTYERLAHDGICPLDSTGDVVCLGIRNIDPRSTITNYLIFYQIGIHDARSANAIDVPCYNGPTDGTYCFTTSVNNLGGPLGSLTSSQPVSPQRVVYDLNVYQDALRLISKTADRDPDHWAIDGVYFGPGLIGHVINNTEWDDFKLSVD